MNIVRAQLLSALQRCIPGVEAGKSVLEGADTFVFSGGKIHSYNDHISVSVPFAPVLEEGDTAALEGAVKAREFFNIVNRLPGDALTLKVKDKSWIMKAGNAKVELTLLEPAVMSRVAGLFKEELAWVPLPKDFIVGLTISKIGCNKSLLAGIFVNDNVMFASDENRINRYLLDGKGLPRFWLADAAEQELVKFTGLSDMALSAAWIHFRGADGTLFSAKRLKDDKFPFDKLAAVVAKHAQTPEDVGGDLPEGLADAVERAATLSMEIDGHAVVRLSFQKEGIECYSERSTGKYREMVSWGDKKPSDALPEISVNVDDEMILYGLKRSKSFYLKTAEVRDRKTGGTKTSVRVVVYSPKSIHLLSTF